MKTSYSLLESILANVELVEENEVNKKESDPIENYIENATKKLNEIRSSLEEPIEMSFLAEKTSEPSILQHDFKFERKVLSVSEIRERHINQEKFRQEPIQYEITKKTKSLKNDNKADLELLETVYFNKDNDKPLLKCNVFVNSYHSPFRSFDDFQMDRLIAHENKLVHLLVSLEQEQMIFSHQAKLMNMNDEFINEKRAIIDNLKKETTDRLFGINMLALHTSNDSYFTRFVNEVIFPIYQIEKDFQAFVVKTRLKTTQWMYYKRDVIDKYLRISSKSESIYLSNGYKSVLICF